MTQKVNKYDYVVIGAGSGGLLVAVGLKNLGKDYAVISENIGGDCTHYGCVPSKTFLYFADKYYKSKSDTQKKEIKTNVLSDVRDKIEEFIDEEQKMIPPKRYFKGKATFIDKNRIQISSGSNSKQIIINKKCVIATGSSPRTIEIKGLPENKTITNEDLFYLDSLPSSITIIGAGPIGAEMATALSKLEVKTYLVSDHYLEKEPEVISSKSLKTLMKLGVRYYSARPDQFKDSVLQLDNGESLPETDLYLLAVGRRPNVDLDLGYAGVEYDKTGIKTNNNLQTSNNNIFAIGDCTRSPKFTHLASNHGKFVLKKLMLPFAQRKDRVLPRVTFVDPPIASVGEVEESNKNRNFKLDISSIDRARVNYSEDNIGVVNIDITTGMVVGASFYGEYGEELISVFTLMIDERIPVLKMTDFITPYPTYSNLLHNLTKKYLSFIVENWKDHKIGSIRQLLSYALRY